MNEPIGYVSPMRRAIADLHRAQLEAKDAEIKRLREALDEAIGSLIFIADCGPNDYRVSSDTADEAIHKAKAALAEGKGVTE